MLVGAVSDAIGVEALGISHPIAEPVDILFLGNSAYAAKTGRDRRPFPHRGKPDEADARAAAVFTVDVVNSREG